MIKNVHFNVDIYTGDQRIPFNEDEGGLPVQFENLELHVYYQWKTGTYEISATATNIQTYKKG